MVREMSSLVQSVFCIFISINLYMFRASMGSLPGDTTVFMRHLVLSGMQGGTLRTRQSSTQDNKYQVSHNHSCISWWWAHSRPKHVEIDRCKYTTKNCAPRWFYLQDGSKQQYACSVFELKYPLTHGTPITVM